MAFDFPVEVVKEGSAEVVVPKLKAFRRAAWDYAPSRAPVFYNPLMRLNRDLAVAALQSYQKMVGHELSVSEPFTGCGVRVIRFAKEVNGIHKIHLNDINPEAFKIAQHNIRLNRLKNHIFITNEDANLFLSRHAAPYQRFDYIDIDPFGAPVRYINSAVRALRDGGLMALTATDLAPLCGVYPRAALRKYGGLSLRTEYCHEIALRLLSGCLATVAARHDIGINILFSHSTNHYIRLYALVNHGAKRANESIREMGYVFHCFRCFHRELISGVFPIANEECSECGLRFGIAGPLWVGNITDRKFCELMEDETAAMKVNHKNQVINMVSLIRAESGGPATYYVVDKICDKLGIPVPSVREVIKKIREKSFKAFATHFHSRGIRTDAPAETVIETIRNVR